MSARVIELAVVAVKDALPDSDETVLLFNKKWSDPCWPGYHDGERWCSAEGYVLDSKKGGNAELLPPTHWARMPALEDAARQPETRNL